MSIPRYASSTASNVKANLQIPRSTTTSAFTRIRVDSTDSPRSVESNNSSPIVCDRDRLTVGMMIISMAREQEITKRSRKYLTSLLQNPKKYNSVIVINLMEVLEDMCIQFLSSMTVSLRNLERVSVELETKNLRTIEGLYFFHAYYLPSRKAVDDKYQELLQTLIAELGMDLDITSWDIDKLINQKTAAELKSEIWSSHLRNLITRHHDSLQIVSPFAEKYTMCLSDSEKLRALDEYLMSLNDYTCFVAQYEYAGRRNYLNSFASICEKALKKRLVRPAADKYHLTNRLWEYFVALISVDQLLLQLDKFSVPQHAELRRSERLDPSAYFRYQSYPIRDVKPIADKILNNVNDDEVKSYIDFLGSYITACDSLIASIEDIVPLLGSMKRGSKHKHASDDLRPLPSAIEKTYRRFAEIKSVTLAQKTALRCWIN